jgi:hypothetical protein
MINIKSSTAQRTACKSVGAERPNNSSFRYAPDTIASRINVVDGIGRKPCSYRFY